MRPEGTLSALLPNDLDLSEFTQTVTLDAESVEAPVTEGQVLGKITLSYDGEEYGTLDLVALNDVARSELLYRIDRVEKFFANPWVKVAAVALILFILVLIIACSIHGKRRRRRTRSYVGYGGRRRR